ncbi:hypothetical protein FA13DRAFT_1742565 [Coprinellus micaceus]|uniref:T6SS Phospholipase effector Tle1-like catalytic domain-containing protein n=1 Tax=Coprinellus micaceus TaxID=71717 RepID=A0A4Y7SGK4_COPMI|nr:hypothetical protein FA13DRAFT_1742565 [Coprinellus micaceus]
MTNPTKTTHYQHSPSVSFGEEIPGLPRVSESPPAIKTAFRERDSKERERDVTSSYYMGSPVVPAQHKARTLILCFDGTGDHIVNFFSALSKGDPENQMVYYQAGIGTYIGRGANPLLTKISKTLDEAVAWNLETHVMDGYEFLMQNYRANDKICIFGFSRGAYTAKCLAGMLHKVGLLPACNHQQVPFAYKMYKRPDEYGWKQSNAFKKAFSIDVDIEFLGVWDTVNSVGIIPRRLPFSASNTLVRTFRHAIALDERRAKFKVNHWSRATQEEALRSITDQRAARREKREEARKAKQEKEKRDHKGHLHHYEARYSAIRHETDVEEVWFAGCHCDVGGGSVTNVTKHSLARIPLRWMIRECFKTNSGIMFQVDELRSLGMDPEALYPIVLPRPPAATVEPETHFIERSRKVQPDILDESEEMGSEADSFLEMTEEEHELYDALSPKYDQLAIKKSWWIGEILPIRHKIQLSSSECIKTWGINKGKGRMLPALDERGAKVHRSVRMRLGATFEDGKKYVPKVVNFDEGKVTWVD